MGQKRIKLVDLAAEEQRKVPRGKSAFAPSYAKAPEGRKATKSKSRQVIKAGKGEHSRLVDMGVSAEEAAAVAKAMAAKAKTEKTKEPTATKTKAKTRKKPKKVRSKRYQALREKIDKTKLYSLEEALPLVLKMANSHFDETVELHLVMKKAGPQTEKKFPLAHKKIGKVSEGEKKLLKALQKTLASVKANEIRKATLTSTMSPSIKLSLGEFQETV